MNNVLKIFLFLMLTAQVALPQNQLNFEFDYARFSYDSSTVYLEFYYELNPKGMAISTTEMGDKIEAIVHIEMKNSETGEYFINRKWKIEDILDENDSIRIANSFKGVLGFAVPVGKYELQVNAYDAENQALNKRISENLELKAFNSEKFEMSDIQLASNLKLQDADPNSIFYKNTLEVTPNPTMVYTEKMPMLFFYAELYNLFLTNPEQNFVLHKNLFNSSGQQVNRTEKVIKPGKKSVVEVGTLNLSKFPTDSYIFELSLVDPATNHAFSSSKRFYLYNPKVQTAVSDVAFNANVASSEYGIMSAEDCDAMFQYIRYIATQREKEQYAKLDSVSTKREFMFNFWRGRDSNPSTPVNEYKTDYMRRVNFANQNYSIMKREGYLSDRGRILLMYGEPDQRDFYSNEAHLKPYETWFYNAIEGGVTFIFGDVTGFGNFELLHSTKRDEVKDDNWMRRISTE
ncbi:MAG: GWxTD domain-containing protein [Melioribacteraceae bacterium]|nr:GWxTD domain-containing protein [Melioribacteraceae bacterium]